MKVVGIDQSANHTGVAVLASDGTLLLSELIEPKTRDTVRLVDIYNTLDALLAKHAPYDIGVWESYSMKSQHRAFLLGEVGGIVQILLSRYSARVESCAPKSLKKFVALSGDASKGEMKAAVARRWGVRFTDDNLADAYGLARFGFALLDGTGLTLRKQVEVRTPRKRAKKKPFRSNNGLL